MKDFNLDKLIYIVYRGKENYEMTLKQCAQETGLTKQEVDILLFLSRNDSEQRACDIVDHRRLSKSYVSKALSSLARKQLVKVEVDNQDHRYQKILLTEKSKKIISYMISKKEEAISKITSEISPADMQIFMKVVGQMALNIEKEGSNIHV